MSEYFTSLTNTDRDLLLEICSRAKHDGKLKFLEIGVFGGATARGIKAFCDQNNIELDYYGVDNAAHPGFNESFQPGIPFLGAKFIKGDSVEVMGQLPNDFDVIFLDGCHCYNHVVLETMHYRYKVRKGGYLVYHDTAPHVQQMYRDPHGPNILLFHNSVNAALQDIEWPWYEWKKTDDKYDPVAEFGGVIAYRRDS